MTTNNNAMVVVGVLYRSPNGKLNEFEDKLENALGKTSREKNL